MTEIMWILLAVVLGLVHLSLAAQMAQKYRTPDWGFGPRDEPIPAQGVAARIDRAFKNFMETFPLFAVAMIAVILQAKTGGLSWWGGLLYVVARIVYIPLYAFGVKYVRTLVWFVAVVGIILILIAAFK
jgi:uncharacterized MAPEG superfamily protein